jgi:FkbM family methyltransferase
MVKRLAAHLPRNIQQEFRKWNCWRDLRLGQFHPGERDAEVLPEMVSLGDCVLDVGANVGYYTLLLSKLVGPTGHVFAFEPIAETAEVLLFMCRFAAYRNITVMQMAASDRAGLVGFDVPASASGLPDYFRASMAAGRDIYCAPLDSFPFPARISFIKVDAEGSEAAVLRGAQRLIRADQPTILSECRETLPAGYQRTYLAGYSNVILRPVAQSVSA